MKQHILILAGFVIASCNLKKEPQEVINRFEVVTRHNVTIEKIDTLASLSVGNGEFAFTTDITGLQTFPEYYKNGIPLGTQSNWGWHSVPNIDSFTLKDVIKYYSVDNRQVPYVYRYKDPETRRKYASEWLRENPHRLHLGFIGIEMKKQDSGLVTPADISNPSHKLNLWTGGISSHFELEGEPVDIELYCHQDMDMISVSIKSPLLLQKRLKIKLVFPYSSKVQTGPGYDFTSIDQHTTSEEEMKGNEITFHRKLDQDEYYVKVAWEQNGNIQKAEAHRYLLVPSGSGDIFEFSCLFSKAKHTNMLPLFSGTKNNSITSYETFWKSGGAVDFSGCTDPRAFELERRVVLSQYLTRIQSSGSLPPQETGLTYNSWYGKFHLEMHWWHSWHFIAWNRPELMEEQMEYYRRVQTKAIQTAKNQGYEGARWQKMTDPDGNESPSNIASFLIWQQPHVIYFAEMLYLQKEDEKILDRYKDLVFLTADFMASYALWDSSLQRYILGPALIPAQEIFPAETTINPSFELAYWHWALQTAQQWKERLGMTRSTLYQQVLDNLSPLPVKDSLYLFTEDAKESYTDSFYWNDHPIVLGVYGFVPETPMVDKAIYANTLEKVISIWHWEKTWGWDFPLSAMAAARMQQPDLAIDLLLMDTRKNTYLVNGHNYQDKRLRLYMPGNGGLLASIAILCNEAEKNDKYIGLSKNGKWNARWENMGKIP